MSVAGARTADDKTTDHAAGPAMRLIEPLHRATQLPQQNSIQELACPTVHTPMPETPATKGDPALAHLA